MVKALDLRSNVRMHTWVRTPFLVWDPATGFFSPVFFLLFFFENTMTSAMQSSHAIIIFDVTTTNCSLSCSSASSYSSMVRVYLGSHGNLCTMSTR